MWLCALLTLQQCHPAEPSSGSCTQQRTTLTRTEVGRQRQHRLMDGKVRFYWVRLLLLYWSGCGGIGCIGQGALCAGEEVLEQYGAHLRYIACMIRSMQVCY